MVINDRTISGWWFQPTPLKNDGVSEFVSWDDFPFPSVSGKSFKIPWFQSPPRSFRGLHGIDDMELICAELHRTW
jgi:hypothetical protein